MKLSVVTPCYNEEENARPLYEAIKAIVATIPGVDSYEQIYIDNCSTDGTRAVLRELAAADQNVKVIFNTRNFGHIRSPYYAMLQATGDAVVCMASDFQDPPSLIPTLVEKWRAGNKAVLCVKNTSKETFAMFFVRRMYYEVMNRLSDVPLIKNATGFGLYDQVIVEQLRRIDDPYPYFRGMVADLGYQIATIPFAQPLRTRGITKNNFYILYDLAMLGITNHSKVPLRLATMSGFLLALMSIGVALLYLIRKLLYWQTFELGLAPLTVGLFFFSSVQLIFIGILGEYLGSIHTQVMKRPLVIEAERLNF